MLGTLFTELEAAKLPMLDGLLSGQEQSIVAEAIFWCVAYALFAEVVSRALRQWYSKFPFWDVCKKRSGTFAANCQDDTIVLSTLTLHHGFGGGLMLAGTLLRDSQMWRHGFLVETGFEIYDLVAMLLGTYPYTHHLKPEVKAIMVFHHIPGISLCVPILSSALKDNIHLHAIGGVLLFAGAISCATGMAIYTLDFGKVAEMRLAALGHWFNVVFYFIARIIIYPHQAYHLVGDLYAGGYSSLVTKGVVVGAVMMMVFNVVLLPDMFAKGSRYMKRARGLDIALETEPVPLSKEDQDRAMQKRKAL